MTNRRPPGAPPEQFEGYHYPDEHLTAPTRPSRRPPPPERGSSSPILLGLVYGGIGLLVLAVAAVTFVVMALPTDLIRREIVAQVKSATGRDLTIAGGASFSIYPTLGVRAGDVSLSPPPGMSGAPFLTAKSINVGVRLLPLLSRKVVVDRLVLHEPVFSLRVDAQGRKSWDMAAASAPTRRVQLAQAEDRKTLRDFSSGLLAGGAQPQTGTAKRLAGLSDVSLGDIRIEDGTVVYADARSGADHRIEAINAQAALASFTQPFGARGNFVWAGQTVAFEGNLASPSDLLAEEPAKLALNLKGAPFTLSYDGSVRLGDAATAEGAVEGNAASLRALAAWLGSKLPPGPGFREVSLAGYLNASEHDVRLVDAKLGLDGATATGTIAVKTSGAKPYVTADLKVANLDLGNYVGGHADKDAAPAARSPAASPSAAAPPPNAASPPRSIEDLIDRQAAPQGPQVRGFTQRAGWSGEPLDLTALGAVNADAKLAVAGLSYGDVHVDASQLSVALKDSVLKTTFEDIKLYQGHGKGFVTIDGAGQEAGIGANFQLSGIAAQPLLKDAAGINWLAGTGDATLTLSGRGASETAIVQSLNGKSNIAVRNGAIIGFNLAGAMRALSEGKIPEFDSSPSEKTDFSELTGSFVIVNGIAKNDDLQLASPLLRASGAGTIDLPARSLDYTVRPKVVATLAGQGGDKDLRGLEVPLHVTGSWEDPVIQPDIASAINNPDTVKAVKELGKNFKGKNAGEIVNDLFGKKENGEPSKAEKLLEKFLGR